MRYTYIPELYDTFKDAEKDQILPCFFNSMTVYRYGNYLIIGNSEMIKSHDIFDVYELDDIDAFLSSNIDDRKSDIVNLIHLIRTLRSS